MGRSPGRPGIIGAAIALGGAAVLLLGFSSTASATPAPSTTTASVQRVCAAPAPHHMACLALRRTGIQPDVPSGYGPTDLKSAYKLPTGGSGATVAIVDAQDDPKAESDLGSYRSTYGLPACTTANGCFKKVNQNGATSPLPSPDTGWAGEISLDVDMVSAVCPSCHILLVEATSPTIQNLGTAVNTAVSLGAKYVSNSYGGGEDGSENSYDSSYFNHPGVAITASTGDDGTGASYPATGRYVTAVGGTSLRTASNSRGWTETAWSGAGSGCSASVAKPTWQNVTTNCSRRAEADVSAVADPNTGVAVYQTYGGSGWAVYGGTSASAPIVASVYALAGTPGASDYPASYPYAHPSNLFDVTSGSNGSCGSPLCTAGTGWDGPTGLGTPNGTAAFTPGGGSGGGVTVANPGNKTGTVGTPVASVTLSASGGTAPYTWTATGLPPGLSISTGGTISGTPTTAGTYSVTATAKDATGATGSTTFTWTISGGGGGGCTAGQLLGNPGFESGTAPWSSTAGVVSANGSGETAHGGTHFAWLDGYGATNTDTLSQRVTVPAACTSATLTFYLHIDTAETTRTTQYDKLTVQAGSMTLATYSNLNAASGYAQKSFSLASFAGQSVTLTFTGTEDSSLQTSFVIDDAALTVS